MILKANDDERYVDIIKNKKEKLEDELYELENPIMYLTKITKMKKKNEKKIKSLEKIIYNKELLMQEYETRNRDLPIDKKIFSVRVLKNNLKEERLQILKEIKELNELIHPEKFLTRKKIIKKQLKYFDIPEDFNAKKILISLQKQIIECMMIDVQNVKNKQELIELMYKYRYYQMLPITANKTVGEIKSLEESSTVLIEAIIKKAQDMNIIKKISKNDEEEFKIIKKILLLKIISFEDINIKLLNERNDFYLVVYDEDIEELKFKIENLNKKDFNIKFNKKTKLFN